MKGVCDLCKEEKEVQLRRDTKLFICKKCYTKYLQPKHKCSKCGEIKKIYVKKEMICKKCYKQPKDICSECGNLEIIKKRDGKIVLCNNCYRKQYDIPKSKCSKCGEIRQIHSKGICLKCYKRPLKKCDICGEEKTLTVNNGTKICCDCYERKKRICNGCNKLKVIARKKDNLCKECINKERMKTDEKFRVTALLRDRVRNAFSNNSTNGKIKKADEYGINYYEIFEYLGPCPGNRKEYHIDHILPISAFDFDNPIHILAAFAPENHQWLKAEENLQKHNKYDKDEFFKYINKFNSGK